MKQLAIAFLILLLVPSVSEARKFKRHAHSRGLFQEQILPTRTSTQIIPHPSGCPRSAFCGCGLAVSIFGRPIRDLWLASNWFKFPRSAPAPGMVGVRRHHVFKLVSHQNGNDWVVEDYNSGGRLSRIHVRSISGYTIVNPHGA